MKLSYVTMFDDSKIARFRILKNFLNLFTIISVVTANTIITAQDSDDEVFVLSPFAVEAGEDVGYVATSTLAGTRIKTEMKDLANSITVATRQMMDDLNANDGAELFQHLGNLESGGIDGNYSGTDTSASYINHTLPSRDPSTANRIRGLASADNTRNFFATGITFDGYSVSRVDVNRGANSTLFGLGSPGGIINHQSVGAIFDDTNQIGLNYGSFGSHRITTDINRVLLEDKLAVRFAGLYEQREWRQEPTFDRDKRALIALNFKPSERGNFKLSYESGAIDARRPRPNGPADTLTRWWEPQSIDPETGQRITHNPLVDNFRDIDRDVLRAPGYWFSYTGVLYDYDSTGESSHAQLAWYLNFPSRDESGLSFQSSLISLTMGEQYYPSATAAANGIEHGSFWGNAEVLDRSIFDYVNHLIDGPNKGEWENFNVINASYDHSWQFNWGHAGVELAFADESVYRAYFDTFPRVRGYALNIDLNTHRQDGFENPNFGRAFMAGEVDRNDTFNDRKTLRATGFTEVDFTRSDNRFVNWLGRQQTTVFGQDYVRDSFGMSSGNRMHEDYIREVTGGTNLNQRIGQARIYVALSPDLSNRDSPVGANIQPVDYLLDDTETTGWRFTGDSIETGIPAMVYDVRNDFETARMLADSVNLTRSNTNSLALVHQGRFFDGGLVATYGARNDRVRNYGHTGITRNAFNLIDVPSLELGADPNQYFEANTQSLGLALHVDNYVNLPGGLGLSFHWGEAENFQIVNPRTDIFGNPIAPPGGDTVDKGFTVSSRDRKLIARFNWYESNSTNTDFRLFPFTQNTDRLVVQYNTQEERDAAGWQGPPDSYKELTNWTIVDAPESISGQRVEQVGAPPISDTQSTSSEGMELEVTFSPNQNLTTSFNVARQEASRSNIGPAQKEYIALRSPEWIDGAGRVLIADNSNQTVNVRIFDSLLNQLNSALSREGQLVPELAEWHANFLANYRFDDDSPLKGFNFGGSLNWIDEKALGYPIVEVLSENGRTIEVPDLANPWMDEARTRLNLFFGYKKRLNDKIDWRLQLNLNNVLESGEAVTVGVQPDGRARSAVWREGITYNLRSTFDF